MKKEKLRISWFPEWLPPEQRIENKMKDIIWNEYEKYWYVNIETPAVERNDVLTSKSWSDVSKQIFGVYWLAQGSDDLKDYSLHFDLTVPLARYVIDNEADLWFPFKRYQIQKVWRGERQQKWRFKEFYQCDIDVIDKNVDIKYDSEIIDILFKTLKSIFWKFNIKKEIFVRLNNRKLFDALFDSIDIDQNKRNEIMKLFDNYYKMDSETFKNMLRDIVWKDADKILNFFSFDIDTIDCNTIDYDDAVKQALSEIKNVHTCLKEKWVNFKFDPYIVRWLDYYTWTIFEMFVEWYENIGSICSGWRFDNLVKYIREKKWESWQDFEWVGWSIGLTRMLSTFLQEWIIDSNESLADVIIFNLDDNANKYREEIANILRNSNLRVDHYLKSEKIDKQFKYAENKNIPFGIFAGEKEEKSWKVVLRDLKERQSREIYKDRVWDTIKNKFKKID
jgi:histidyl-tRNA synthetase